MKYVVYFSKNGDNDSLIVNSKKDFIMELKSLIDEGFIINKTCRVVRGEYVPFLEK